jgi:hypothetical protein
MGQEVMTLQEKLLLVSVDKTAKLAKSSEIIVQKNSLREHNPRAVSIPQLLRGTSGVQPPETVQKDSANEGSSPDPDGVNYARPLKVTKAGSYACALIFKPFRLLAKGKFMSLAKAFRLSKDNIKYNFQIRNNLNAYHQRKNTQRWDCTDSITQQQKIKIHVITWI